MNNDIRNLTKWLNEGQEAPIDRQALARVLAVAEQPAQEPVAWRAWFDADNGARWLFSLWPEEERLDVEWQPLYTSPPASKPDFKEFNEWAVAAGYDTAHAHDGMKWVCLNPMTADLWKAWQAAHGIKENT